MAAAFKAERGASFVGVGGWQWSKAVGRIRRRFRTAVGWMSWLQYGEVSRSGRRGATLTCALSWRKRRVGGEGGA